MVFRNAYTCQTDFYINYIDPVSGGVRAYYPDFLALDDEGTYHIIEVKGDNKIDDAVVLAKKQYAEQIASASNMKYIILRGSDCENGVGIHQPNCKQTYMDYDKK